MKINYDINKKTQQPAIAKIEKFFFQGKIKIKQLFKDVFEKKCLENESSIEYPRSLPNSFGAKDEKFSTSGGGYLKYYPEDIEKMKTLTEDELIKFKQKLHKAKKYYIE